MMSSLGNVFIMMLLILKVFIEGLPCVGTYSVEEEGPFSCGRWYSKRTTSYIYSTITTIRVSRQQSDVENLRNCYFLKLS